MISIQASVKPELESSPQNNTIHTRQQRRREVFGPIGPKTVLGGSIFQVSPFWIPLIRNKVYKFRDLVLKNFY